MIAIVFLWHVIYEHIFIIENHDDLYISPQDVSVGVASLFLNNNNVLSEY